MTDRTPLDWVGYLKMTLESASRRMQKHYRHCVIQPESTVDPRPPLETGIAILGHLKAALEPDVIAAADIPSTWTAVTDGEGLLWLKRTNRRNRWTAEGERGVMMEGVDLLYEYGPLKKAVDPRG